MRSRSIEPRKAGHTLRIGKARIVVRILIHLVNGIGVGTEDHIITSRVELQNLTLPVNAIGVGEESLIQGIEKAGVELRMLILPVPPNTMIENARRKGITELTHLILILAIMNTRKDSNLVKTEAENILDTTSTEEKIMQNENCRNIRLYRSGKIQGRAPVPFANHVSLMRTLGEIRNNACSKCSTHLGFITFSALAFFGRLMEVPLVCQKKVHDT